MSAIANIDNPWRKLLRTEASFRGVVFHVESGSRISGDRTVVHEYPKRDMPYSESMGRHARRFNFTGYLIYKPGYDYTGQRKKLIEALEKTGPGPLVHPVFAYETSSISVLCERYTMTESRQRGGYTEFEMQFVEAGNPGNSTAQINPSSNVSNNANNVEVSAKSNIDGAVPLPTPRPSSSLADSGVHT